MSGAGPAGPGQIERWLRRFGALLASSRSVSGAYVQSLEPAAEHFGLDLDALLRAAGIDPVQLQRPDHRIPIFDAFRLAELAAERSGDPCFGLVAGSFVRPRSFQVLGYSAMSSATLRDAIDRLLRFEKLTWDIGVSELIEAGDEARLRLIPEGLSLVPRQVIELSISGWFHIGRALLDDDVPLRELRFHHERIGPQSRYEDTFGCPVRFGQPYNEACFDRALLDAPLADSDPALRASMDALGEKMLSGYRHGTNLVNEVRAEICRLLPDGEPAVERVAEALEMTPRTLRARLRAAQAGFQSQVDEVRHRLALKYISDAQLNLVEVAFLLGFSDQSTFTRAFKRWTGETPGSCRARLLQAREGA